MEEKKTRLPTSQTVRVVASVTQNNELKTITVVDDHDGKMYRCICVLIPEPAPEIVNM